MVNTSVLFSEYRRRVLGLLLLHPENRYHVREIARLTSTTAGTLHRELSKLAKAQVLIREVSGNQVYYQANRNFPIFNELASILKKTSGLVDILADALAPLIEKIEVAFVFGSVARGTENLGSDIDVLIIGNVGFAEVVAALYPAQTSLGREINPKIYSQTQWKKCLSDQDVFIQEIMNSPKLFVIGEFDDIR
ncbi:nucleotidyltransferase [Legionella lansingensis]|uniref:Nucleotidyltransferase domain protein n=1 Tax=Legionella lansingensis TaxID=45067 RepID=A0A0W0VRT4_9GAMM|nr:nucleotidyltransferase domain-containing protein [Legionella lansingensis]KTD22892.1 Nucleotidyltransferase domain protein [Legionella lansingensis]SNV53804.1 nucleotidyltransferase [Legionella lansingensis]